ncbi:MAG TPA: hypothetical protein VN936_10215, partial [Candidatus Acidoferrum sp.]|nr:hypothetical protein [Candidatus Acidoferrum sp.]
MRPFGHRFAFVEDGYGEADAWAVDHNNLDFRPHDETNWDRFVVFEIDMGAQRDLTGIECGF